MQLSDGSCVKTDGCSVNMQDLDVDTTAPICYLVNAHYQEKLFNISSTTASQMVSSTSPSLPSAHQQTGQVSHNTVISVSSVQSVLTSV